MSDTEQAILEEIYGRLRRLEAAAGITRPEPSASRETDAQALMDAAYGQVAPERYTPPPGIVSPHVSLNLRAIREWIDVALAGGDVQRP